MSLITYKKTSGATGDFLPGTADYVLWYVRDIDSAKYRTLHRQRIFSGSGAAAYDQVQMPDRSRRRLTLTERADESAIPSGALQFRYQILTSQAVGREKGEGAASWFPVQMNGRDYRPSLQHRWKTNQSGMARLLTAERIAPTGNSLSYIRYFKDFPAFPYNNLWDDTQSGSSMDKVYVVQTNTKVIERCMLMTTDPGDLVLDPTCGSGTTAYVAEQWGRRWITIDTSRVAIALARQRLMGAKLPYYLLADSPAGRAKETQLTGKPATAAAQTNGDVRKGFVYERVPHVTLKSIANNPDIHEGMSRKEVDAAIARHAETELLFDRPYEDKKTVRVAGPFTVESLSPHRSVAFETEVPEAEARSAQDASSPSYEQTILENLAKAGVQNGRRKERLTFDTIEPYAGRLSAGRRPAGECRDRHAGAHRDQPGPGVRHGEPVLYQGGGPRGAQGAGARPAAGARFRLRRASAGDGGGVPADRHQRLRVGAGGEAARQAAGAACPDECRPGHGRRAAEKTGAGNLFTVFGEPDVSITATDSGELAWRSAAWTSTTRRPGRFGPTTPARSRCG